MTRWTPLSIYLTALSYTTGIVILAGTFAVQAWSEWPTIRNRPESTAPHSKPRPTTPSHNADPVKPGLTLRKDGGRAYSSSVTGREWTPSRGTLRSDWDREPRLSKHGVRRVPAREPSSLRFTETGRVPSLQAVVYAAAGLCGVSAPLAWSLALRESSGRHWDAFGAVLTSSSGAVGVLQIKPSTARDVATDLDVMQPWGNALAGLCYFRQMLDKAKGNVRRALAYYHRGPNAKGPTPKASHDYATDIIQGSAN